MDILLDTYKNTGNLHHAYLIEGEREVLYTTLCSFLADTMGVQVRGNPDFYYGDFDTFGIDEARALKEMHMQKAFGGGKKIYIISANSIFHEAQNSLLKILEEPTPSTHFFILVRSSEALLPTLKSRMVTISRGESNTYEGEISPASFLKKNPADRIKLFGDIIEEKDKSKAISFLNSLEEYLHQKIKAEKISPTDSAVFEEIIKARSYLTDRSPSVKMLLEHLALVIPIY